MNVQQLVDKLIEDSITLTFPEWEQLIVKELRSKLPNYSWVGFYWVNNDRLELGAWTGPEATEHVSIPIGEGICGLAARTKETVIVDDVHSRSEYLACFPYTKSEIVVPILRDGNAIGELDVDGDSVGGFKEEDKIALERLAISLAEKYPV